MLPPARVWQQDTAASGTVCWHDCDNRWKAKHEYNITRTAHNQHKQPIKKQNEINKNNGKKTEREVKSVLKYIFSDVHQAFKGTGQLETYLHGGCSCMSCMEEIPSDTKQGTVNSRERRGKLHSSLVLASSYSRDLKGKGLDHQTNSQCLNDSKDDTEVPTEQDLLPWLYVCRI